MKTNENDEFSSINLLKENYIKSNCPQKDYPLNEYFYYSDYINEEYIKKKLEHKEESKFPLINKYLDYNDDIKQNDYSLSNLNIFNSALNLINEKYSCQITRENAESILLKDDEIYRDDEYNKKLFDKFIKFYNNLKIKKKDGEIIILSVDNPLSNFVVDDSNEITQSYKTIYKNFINLQNSEVDELLSIKVRENIFDVNCKEKINIQNIKENEIFLMNLPNKFSFTEVLFNNSYRKIALDSEYQTYNEYEIDLESIEEDLTEILLKNKKLLKDDIVNFIYKNEDLSFNNTNIITKFQKKYLPQKININDKVILYQFYEENKNYINVCKNVLNDFIKLIAFLNNTQKFKESNKIYEVLPELGENISNDFTQLFDSKEKLTIDKICDIFEYYQALIFELIKNEFKIFQTNLDENSKEKIKAYFENKEDENIKNKKDLSKSLRIFITVYLSQLKDKEKTIKMNRNNIINYYTDIPDLWISNEIKLGLMKLKEFNVQINQVLNLYEELGGDIGIDFCNDVKEQIKQIEEMNKPKPKFEDNQPNKEITEKMEPNKDENYDDYFNKRNDEDEDEEGYGGRD